MKRINGIAVSQIMYNDIIDAKDMGSKCFLTRPEPMSEGDTWSNEFKDEICPNCEGAGKLGLQIIVGGPYDYVPPTAFKGWNEKKEKDDPGPRATFFDGHWWLQKTREMAEYTCPICHGTGSAPAVRARTEPVVF